jgi:ABC-type Fe3+/spermidine/putrescine transport system ATPase subunit
MQTARGSIAIRCVSKTFGSTRVLHPLDLSIAAGTFVTLLGPSGCGKTTLLRIIAGFVDPTAGGIEIDGASMADVPAQRRPIGMVFQSLALFPHLDVFENVAYGLRIRRTPRAEIASRVARFLGLVGLDGFAQRSIGSLSGGQKQRVALARSLVLEPSILLLDEPLSALDLQLKKQLQVELKTIQRDLATTFVFVTHDQEEASVLSDQVIVMDHGRIRQIGSPREIYAAPADAFVARFIGDVNMLPGEILSVGREEIVLRIAGQVLRSPASVLADGASSGPCQISFRPEAAALSPSDQAADVLEVKGRVRTTFAIGPTQRIVSETEHGPLLATFRTDDSRVGALRPGDEARFRVPAAAVRVFPA